MHSDSKQPTKLGHSLLLAGISALAALIFIMYFSKPSDDAQATLKKIATIGTINNVLIDVMYLKYGFDNCYVLVQVSPQDQGRAFSTMVCK